MEGSGFVKRASCLSFRGWAFLAFRRRQLRWSIYTAAWQPETDSTAITQTRREVLL